MRRRPRAPPAAPQPPLASSRARGPWPQAACRPCCAWPFWAGRRLRGRRPRPRAAPAAKGARRKAELAITPAPREERARAQPGAAPALAALGLGWAAAARGGSRGGAAAARRALPPRPLGLLGREQEPLRRQERGKGAGAGVLSLLRFCWRLKLEAPWARS